MRIHIQILRTIYPSGTSDYHYQCKNVDPTFTPPFIRHRINPYEPQDYMNFTITVEEERDGFEYYWIHTTTDIDGVKFKFQPLLLKALTEQLNKHFSNKEITPNELAELSNQMKSFLSKLDEAHYQGAIAGFFVKLGLPAELAQALNLSRKDTENVVLSTISASQGANEAVLKILSGYTKPSSR